MNHCHLLRGRWEISNFQSAVNCSQLENIGLTINYTRFPVSYNDWSQSFPFSQNYFGVAPLISFRELDLRSRHGRRTWKGEERDRKRGEKKDERTYREDVAASSLLFFIVKQAPGSSVCVPEGIPAQGRIWNYLFGCAFLKLFDFRVGSIASNFWMEYS